MQYENFEEFQYRIHLHAVWSFEVSVVLIQTYHVI